MSDTTKNTAKPSYLTIKPDGEGKVDYYGQDDSQGQETSQQNPNIEHPISTYGKAQVKPQAKIFDIVQASRNKNFVNPNTQSSGLVQKDNQVQEAPRVRQADSLLQSILSPVNEARQGLQEIQGDKPGQGTVDLLSSILHGAMSPVTIPINAGEELLNKTGSIGQQTTEGINRAFNLPFDAVKMASQGYNEAYKGLASQLKKVGINLPTGDSDLEKKVNQLLIEGGGLALMGAMHGGAKEFVENKVPVPNIDPQLQAIQEQLQQAKNIQDKFKKGTENASTIRSTEKVNGNGGAQSGTGKQEKQGGAQNVSQATSRLRSNEGEGATGAQDVKARKGAENEQTQKLVQDDERKVSELLSKGKKPSEISDELKIPRKKVADIIKQQELTQRKQRIAEALNKPEISNIPPEGTGVEKLTDKESTVSKTENVQAVSEKNLQTEKQPYENIQTLKQLKTVPEPEYGKTLSEEVRRKDSKEFNDMLKRVAKNEGTKITEIDGINYLEDKKGRLFTNYRQWYDNDPLYKSKEEISHTPASQEVPKEAPKITKVKDFKTDEGNFSTYDVSKNVRGRADMFTVSKDKDGFIVRNALLPDELKRKGIATGFYKQMNEESLKETGKPLRSTQPRKLLSGETVHELTPDAVSLWDSFVKKGLAEKIDDKNYKFLEPTDNNKSAAMGMFERGKKDMEVLKALGLKNEPKNMNQVREWRKEAEGNISPENKKVIDEVKKPNLINDYAKRMTDMQIKLDTDSRKESGLQPRSEDEISKAIPKGIEQNAKYLNKLKSAIDDKDYKTLSDNLHTDNKTSRKFFEEYTSEKLPNTQKGTIEQLKKFSDYKEPEKPITQTMSKQERQQKFNDARDEKILSKEFDYGKDIGVVTRKEFIDKQTDKGYEPTIEQHSDMAKFKKMQDEYERLRRSNLPLGNRNIPQVARFYELRDQLAGDNPTPPQKDVYMFRKKLDNGQYSGYELTKAEYDYANRKKVETPKETVQPEVPAVKEMTTSDVINRDYKNLKDKLGEKKAQKYFEQVDKLINPNENNIVEYRENGVVTKEGDKRIFHALSDTDLKNWRIGFDRDITNEAPVKEDLKPIEKPFVKDEVSKTMLRGSNESVTPEYFRRIGGIEFNDWVKNNSPLRNALRKEVTKGKQVSVGGWGQVLRDYLKNKGYEFTEQDYGKEAFADYLEDLNKSKVEKPNRIISDESYKKAQQNIITKGQGISPLGIGPTLLKDYATIGAYHVESGLRSFAKWSEKMIEDFGEDIKPHLQDIWKQTKSDFSDLFKDEKAAAPAKVEDAKLDEKQIEPSTKVPKEAETKGAESGIAQRIREQRADITGMKASEIGQGYSAEDMRNIGNSYLKQGISADDIISDFKKDKKISADTMAIANAHADELAHTTNLAEDKYGVDSPQYKEAAKKEKAFLDEVKPMQTMWSNIGKAQQGGVDIDTGTFSGIRRAYETQTGKEFTPGQSKRAKKLSNTVKELTDKEQKLNDRIQELISKNEDLEKNLANKRAGDKSIKASSKALANKIRTAKIHRPGAFYSATPATLAWDLGVETVAKSIEAGGVVAEAIQDGIKALKETDWYKALGEGRQKEAEKQFTDWHNDQLARKIEDFNFADKKGNKFTPNEAKAVWGRAKEGYIDKGVTDFNDMVDGLSKETGLSHDQVRNAIAQPKQLREITDEMYRARYARQRAILNAKAWIRSADTPKTIRFIRSVPNIFFGLKVFGHGTVGMITHAGMDIFKPSAWNIYFPNFIRQFKFAYGDVANYQKAIEDLQADPDYIMWKRAGLAVDPTRIYDDYMEIGKLFGKFGEIGNKGFQILKVHRLETAKSIWSHLSEIEKADPETAQRIAEQVNSSTGTSKVVTPKILNVAMFAPRLEWSRWQRLIIEPAKAIKTFTTWKNAKPSEKVAAKLTAKSSGERLATMAALLAANQAILTLAGSNQKINFTDPTKSDWLRFKAGNKVIDVSGGMLSTITFVARLAEIIVEDQKKLYGKSRFETAVKFGGNYIRGKASPFAGNAVDWFSHTDYMGNVLPPFNDKPKKGAHKYTWGEYLLTQQTPIPAAEGIKDVYDQMKAKGMSTPQIEQILTGVFLSVVSGGTGARAREEISDKKKPIRTLNNRLGSQRIKAGRLD